MPDTFTLASQRGLAADTSERCSSGGRAGWRRGPTRLLAAQGLTLRPLPPPLPHHTAWVYRPAFGGGDAEAAGFRARCDQAPTPKQVKGDMLQVSGSPAYTQVAPGKAALRQALAAQPAVALLALDPSFQHYAGGVWSPSVPCAGALRAGRRCGKGGGRRLFPRLPCCHGPQTPLSRAPSCRAARQPARPAGRGL